MTPKREEYYYRYPNAQKMTKFVANVQHNYIRYIYMYKIEFMVMNIYIHLKVCPLFQTLPLYSTAKGQELICKGQANKSYRVVCYI
jgi:hypothetical protein